MSETIDSLRNSLRHFAAERDWDQFHSPKNLAISINVEAAELLEHFQWINEANSPDFSEDQLSKVGEEMADVFLYLIRLADKLDIDLIQAASKKLLVNAAKYPVDKAKGSNKKYSDL